MAYYKEKVETGNEYVMKMRDFYTYTLNKCMKLPQRWYEPIIKPVIEPVERARTNTVKANKVYINVKQQKVEEFKLAIEERDRYLIEALRELSAFDIAFDVLVSYIDVENYERVRMKSQLENIIRNIKNENPDLKSIEIKLEHRENEISFVSLAGNQSTKLKITPRNIEYWIGLEANVENKIKQRISKDKQFLKQYR